MSEGTSVCAGCNQLIQNTQCIVADGKKYHVDHFVCKNCQNPLTGGIFRKKNNEIYCDKCYQDLFAFPCAACNEKIMGKHLIVSDKRFHSNCFVCSNCTTQFGQKGYFEKNGQYLCEKCLIHLQNRFCAKCDQSCIENAIFSIGKYWHEECFLCQKCQKQLQDTYVNVDNQAYHLECLVSDCIVCGLSVTDEYCEINPETICHPACVMQYKPGMKKVQKQDQQAPSQQHYIFEEFKQQQLGDVIYPVKKIEQQDVNQLNPDTLDPNRPRFPYTLLKQCPPPDNVVVTKKELYLSDEEFEKVFKMKLSKFLTLKEWKRIQLKKEVGLF